MDRSTPSPGRLLRSGALLTALNVVGGGLGYAFQVLMGWVLAPADFTVFNAVLATITICCAPLNAVVMVLAREVAVLRGVADFARVRLLYRRSGAWLLLAGAAFCGAAWVCGPGARDFLRVPDATGLWLAAVIAASTSVAMVNGGFLQGLQDFGWLGGLNAGGVAAKIVICLLFVAALGWGLQGALGGVLVSWLLVAGIGVAVIAGTSAGAGSRAGPPRPFPLATMIPVGAANIAFAALTQLDIVLVNYFFEPAVASEYAAASILGKAVLYLPGGIVLALFPMVAEDHAAARGSGGLVRQALFATLVLCGAAALVYAVLGPRLVAVLYGGKYPRAGGLLAAYGLAVLPIGVAMVAMNFLIAQGRLAIAWVFLAAALAELAVIWAWHPSPGAVIGVLAVVNAVLAVASCWLLRRELVASG